MSWENVVVQGDLYGIVEMLKTIGVEVGEVTEVEKFVISDFDLPIVLKSVELRHVLRGEVMIIEEYMQSHTIWESGGGSTYVVAMAVHAPGEPVPNLEERNKIVEETVLQELDFEVETD